VPINHAMQSYRETRGVLAVVYFLLVSALVYFGMVTLNQPQSAPATTGASVVPFASSHPPTPSPTPLSAPSAVTTSTMTPSAVTPTAAFPP
jgi:hypothetical protein